MAADAVTQGTGRERNGVAVVRRVFEALTTGDMGVVEEFISPDYIDHDASGAKDRLSVDGHARFCENVEWLHRVLANVAFEEQEIIAAGDRVVVRGVIRARHVGRLLGIAPTGQQIEICQVHMFRLGGDKVAEHRSVWGELSLLLQMGAWP